MAPGSRDRPRMGNQAALRLLGGGVIQAKLKVNQPGDPFEQEADQVANAVVGMSGPVGIGAAIRGAGPASVQRRCSCAGSGSCKQCQEQAEVQRSEMAGDSNSAPPSVDHVVRSPGQPLSRESRAFFEPRFGRNFENVRIHTDSAAAASARDIRALAYTTGSDIAFGAGRYRPETLEGRRLIAHELTHVVQQSSNRVARSVQRVCGPTDIAAAVAGRASCNDSFGGRFLSGLPLFKFNQGCDDFATGQDTALQTSVAGEPATATFEIHGFASSDGATAFNRDLGCARAMKAFSVMTTADSAHGFAGIAAPRITAVVNHGPVSSSSAPASSLRSVVIRVLGGSPGPTPTPAPPGLQTVTIPPDIRGAATPPAMTQNRIPPRVATPVTVTFAGTPTISTPVILSVEGGGSGNGSATVDGAPSASFAVTGATIVNLRGVDQTLDAAHAGNLRLVARQRGTQIAASNGFSVSSIPVSMSHPFNRFLSDADCTSVGLPAACGLRGILVHQTMDSDSGVPADLDRAKQSERIEAVTMTGIFAGATAHTGCYVSCTPSPDDANGSGVAGRRSPGVRRSKQTFMFRDNRTGASEIPMADSGFRISQIVGPVPGSGFFGFGQSFQLEVSSIGTAHGATDPNTTCPSGTITSTAGRTSVTKTIPL